MLKAYRIEIHELRRNDPSTVELFDEATLLFGPVSQQFLLYNVGCMLGIVFYHLQ